MAFTYEPIQTTTLGSNTQEVSLTSIPSTYTDFRVVINAKFTSTTGNCVVRVNSDSGSNYCFQRLTGSGSAAAAARGDSQSSLLNMFDLENPNTNYRVSTFDFLGYTNTSIHRGVLSEVATDDYVKGYVSYWMNTSSAITSVSFSVGPAYFVSGSTFTVYGVKAA